MEKKLNDVPRIEMLNKINISILEHITVNMTSVKIAILCRKVNNKKLHRFPSENDTNSINKNRTLGTLKEYSNKSKLEISSRDFCFTANNTMVLRKGSNHFS